MKKLLFLTFISYFQVSAMNLANTSTSAALNIITPALQHMRNNQNPNEESLPPQPAIPPVSYNQKADVVLLHGLGSTSYNMGSLRGKIENKFPNTQVHNLTIPMEYRYNLIEQQNWLIKELHKPQYNNVGTIIGQSQGAVLARSAIEHGAPKQIVSAILSVGPQQGVAGFPGDWDDKDWNAIKNINKWTKFAHEAAHVALDLAENHVGPLVAYNKLTEKSALGALYNPPYHQKTYREKNPFLPIINNEVGHNDTQTFHDNITRISKYLVCLRAQKETTLEPPATAWFGYYKKDNRDAIVQVENTPVFKNLGLDQLAARKAFYRLLLNGNHGNITDSQTNFDTYIAPFIADKSDLTAAKPLQAVTVPAPKPLQAVTVPAPKSIKKGKCCTMQ